MSKFGLVIILALILLGCSDQKDKEQPVSPRIKKETKVVSPKNNQKFKIGDPIPFEIKAQDVVVDSISLEIDGVTSTYSDLNFSAEYTSTRVGQTRTKITVYFEGKKETHYPRVTFLPSSPPEEYTYEIVKAYPHDVNDYIQGLLINDGFLYESTGRNGRSTLEKKNIETGETLAQYNLNDEYFGEGLALLNNQFYQLTYHSGACFVYDMSFNLVRSFAYDGEGWGLSEYQGNLLMTNGSEKIFVRNPETFSIIDELQVYDSKGKVDYLNELEIIDDLIYANVYQKDYLVAIDPTSGAVVKKIDLSGLSQGMTQIDVLNGIAYDAESDRVFVTGKLWPKLFEIKFIPKNQS